MQLNLASYLPQEMSEMEGYRIALIQMIQRVNENLQNLRSIPDPPNDASESWRGTNQKRLETIKKLEQLEADLWATYTKEFSGDYDHA